MDPTPRLMIHKVTLENFKSYAGFKEIGPFHKNFSAVVGPNGSGKSNLLECLLFAFGKSARKMRLKRLSDLIHSSREHPDLKFTRVSVFFVDILDYDSYYEPVPGTELTLTRSVNRDSKSQYRIDGRDSTYEEVTTLLKDRGVDLLHNRFLILQGEVEQIAMMKSRAAMGEDKAGLLEYLEEIIGTNVYVNLIQNSEKQLEGIGEEVTLKTQRSEQAEKELAQLKEPKDKAMEYLKNEEKLHQVKNLKLQVLKGQVQEEAARLECHIERTLGEIEGVHREIDLKLNEQEEFVTAYNGLVEDMKGINDTEQTMKAQLQGYLKKDNALEQKLKRTKEQMNEVTEELQKTQRRAEDLVKKAQKLHAEVPANTERIAALHLDKAPLDKEFQTLHLQVLAATESLQQSKTNLEQELVPLNNQLHDIVTKLDSTDRKVHTLETSRTNNERELEGIKGKLTTLHSRQQELNKNYMETHEQLKQFKTEITQKNQEFTQTEERYTQGKAQLAGLQRELTELETLENQAEGYSRQLSEIMAAKRSGRLEGVYGRLGDLATIPSEFDIAISSAAPRLDFLLVQSAANANALLDFVRSKGLGKISIIDLSKVTREWGHKSNAQFVATGTCQRLFDLVCPEDIKFAPAFYFLLKDTLVARTMDEARKVAFGENNTRRRVVTFTGEIINPSGEMQGFSQPKRGKMRIQGTQTVFKNNERASQLRTQLNTEKQQLAQLQTQLKDTQAKTAELRRYEGNATQTLKLLQNDLVNLDTELEHLAEKRDWIHSLTSETAEEELGGLRELRKQQTKVQGKAADLAKKKGAQLEAVVLEIENQGGEEFKQIRHMRDSLARDIQDCEDQLVRTKNQLKQTAKETENNSERQQSLDSELNEFQGQCNNSLGERTEIRRLSEELIMKYKEIQTLSSAKKEEISGMDQAKNEFEKLFKDLNAHKDSLSCQNKEFRDRLRTATRDTDKWQRQVELNRKEFHSLWKDYKDLAGDDMELDEEPQSEEPHQNKRRKTHEDLEQFFLDTGKTLSSEELQCFTEQLTALEAAEKVLKHLLNEAQPELAVILKYKEQLTDQRTKQHELSLVRDQEKALRDNYLRLKSKRFSEFQVGFTVISAKLREMYQLITQGGDAELEFVDSTDPFSEGINFTVRPPLKSWKKMANLSGGERTLSSLALVFALHHYKPNALYVMDEVDAALDYKNVSIIANYIKSRTKDAQFIIVSLRYQMFELADLLVGIYKTHNDSKSLTICPSSLNCESSENPIISQTVNNLSTR